MKQVCRAIITNAEGKVLLGKRARGDGVGLYALIGGKLDPGEDALNAIIREVKEEIGLEFSPTFYLEEVDSISDPQEPWMVTYFTGPVFGELKLRTTEVEEVIYISEVDLDRIDIAFNHREKLIKFFNSALEKQL